RHLGALLAVAGGTPREDEIDGVALPRPASPAVPPRLAGCHPTRSLVGCDGPIPSGSTEVAAARTDHPFFRRLTGDCRINAVADKVTRPSGPRSTWIRCQLGCAWSGMAGEPKGDLALGRLGRVRRVNEVLPV